MNIRKGYGWESLMKRPDLGIHRPIIADMLELQDAYRDKEVAELKESLEEASSDAATYKELFKYQKAEADHWRERCEAAEAQPVEFVKWISENNYHPINSASGRDWWDGYIGGKNLTSEELYQNWQRLKNNHPQQ